MSRLLTFTPGLLYVRGMCNPDEDLDELEIQFEVPDAPFLPRMVARARFGYEVQGQWWAEPYSGKYIECSKGAAAITGSGRIVIRRRATDEDLELIRDHWCCLHATPAQWIESEARHFIDRGLDSNEVERLCVILGSSK